MTKFIKVTEVRKADGKHSPLLINRENINSVKQSEKGPDTHINMKDSHYFFVKESVLEVEAMLCTT